MGRIASLLALPLIAALGACSGSQIPTSAMSDGTSFSNNATRAGANAAASSASLNGIGNYSFGGGSDGSGPFAPLTEVNGIKYGTTQIGGTRGCGTVFGINAAGAETVLYSLCGVGGDPNGGLTEVNGALYGTTFYGGTVYKITPSGRETVVYKFAAGPNGACPTTDACLANSNLTNVNGTLYGTSSAGGTNNFGTVYSITPAGVEHVVYSFGGAPTDGRAPGGVIAVNGVLYGTTNQGGASNLGTVYQLTTSGSEHVMHSFGEGTDGAYPDSELTNVHGTLYGTASYGGASNEGVAFSISQSGYEKVLHSFGVDPDGKHPSGGLTFVGAKGLFYGTTQNGGGHEAGTVYSLTPTGGETVIRRFTGGTGGAGPTGFLVDFNGVLYGTTYAGGATNNGMIFHVDL